ncbi:hypothetical protein [Paraburkholderia sp. BR14374]|uniref:hypothetical protein n=1 Tax=Paraburkholderia sp. BR14374 TaxID=3237007 RepID=UPI0034CF6D47
MSAGTANAASSKSDTAIGTANTALNTANDAKTTAQGIDGKAQSALDTAAGAVTTANGAVATANGIDAKASSALTQAGNAVTTANAASTKADNAVSTANSVSGTATDAKTTAAAAKATADAASAAVATAVQKGGDTMTGPLTLKQTSGAYSPQVYFNANGYAPFIRANNAAGQGGSIEIVNGAGSMVNVQIYDSGSVNVRGGLYIGGDIIVTGQLYAKQRIHLFRDGIYGEMGIRSTDGSYMYLRGREGNGGMQLVNNAYNAVVVDVNDGGDIVAGSITSRGNIFLPGHVTSGNGNGTLAEDGNTLGGAWNNRGGSAAGGYDALNSNKADRYANCVYNSGLIELGGCNVGGNNTSDCGNPYVLVGLRTQAGTNNVWPRAIYLRNN